MKSKSGSSSVGPHPLDGPRLKVRRAESKIADLREADETFRRDAKYHFRQEEDTNTGENVYSLVMDGPKLSLEWGVDIGEVAHNLRSSLDNLVYQLVLLNGETPTDHTGFPICLTAHDFSSAQGSRLVGVSPKHQAMIEWLQPHKCNRGNRADALFVLHNLNISDKHRVVQVVGAARRVFSIAGTAWQPKHVRDRIVVDRTAVILEDGAKIVWSPAEMPVKPILVPLVAFADGIHPKIVSVIRGQGVVFWLSRMRDRVFEAVETFAGEFSTCPLGGHAPPPFQAGLPQAADCAIRKGLPPSGGTG